MNDRLPRMLGAGFVGLILLWLTFAPTAVTRGEMRDYVEATATEHLRLLREDLRDVRSGLAAVGERLAAVEAILRER